MSNTLQQQQKSNKSSTQYKNLFHKNVSLLKVLNSKCYKQIELFEINYELSCVRNS